MKLILNDGKILKECFSSIGRIIDEAIIECDGEGMRLRALDRSHVSFVELDFKASLFDEYECDVPEKINVDTVDLNTVLKRYKNNEILEIETDEDLIIRFKGDSNRSFKLRLISLDYETPAPPNLEFPVELDVSCDFIKDALKDIEIYSEKVRFKVDEDYLFLIGDGEFGDVTDKIVHGAEVFGGFESVFSLDKVDEMLKDIKFNDELILDMGDDMPLLMKVYVTGNNNSNDGFIRFLLAPRLEEDDY